MEWLRCRWGAEPVGSSVAATTSHAVLHTTSSTRAEGRSVHGRTTVGPSLSTRLGLFAAPIDREGP